MPSFSLGDIVRVARQPKGMHAHVDGQVGYIEELHPNGTHALINALKADGTLSGSGTVPLDCLEPESSKLWKAAKGIYDAELERRFSESRARTERYHVRMGELSAKYEISVENIKALQSDLRTLSDRDWWPE